MNKEETRKVGMSATGGSFSESSMDVDVRPRESLKKRILETILVLSLFFCVVGLPFIIIAKNTTPQSPYDHTIEQFVYDSNSGKIEKKLKENDKYYFVIKNKLMLNDKEYIDERRYKVTKNIFKKYKEGDFFNIYENGLKVQLMNDLEMAEPNIKSGFKN